MPVVALAWPAALIRPALDYVDAQDWPPAFRSDDEIAGRCLRHLRAEAYATVPSLVQHEDVLPSLIGRKAAAGADPARVAYCFASADCDVATIDWTPR